MIIGLTGLIGSGKSTVASIFKANKFAVIDADQIGKNVVNQNKELLNKLTKLFGQEILDKNKKLNRAKLAGLAFTDDKSRKKLNRAVHPYLLKELKRQLNIFKKQKRNVLIDAALLLDWNLDEICDYVLLIHASESDRLERVNSRGISKQDFLARQNKQIPFRKQRARADYCVFNNSSEPDLKRKITTLIKKLI